MKDAIEPQPGRHLAALDGLRGLAILGVLWLHALPACHAWFFATRWEMVYGKVAHLGAAGVDLFFVLSGFLITGILLDTRGRHGYFASFYARRTLRIFPLHYLALFIGFVVARPLLTGLDWYDAMVARQWWYWTYTYNWWVSSRGAFPSIDIFGAFWSLGVEEQFYIVWPFIVAALRPSRLLIACAAAVAISLATRLWDAAHGSLAGHVHTSTWSRIDLLAIGGAVAALVRCGVPLVRQHRVLLPIAAIALVEVAVAFIRHRGDYEGDAVAQTALGVAFAALLVAAATAPPDGRLARLLQSRVLRWFGTRSYALYIAHQSVMLWLSGRWSLQHHLPAIVDHLAFLATALAITGVIAECSWRWFESPLLGLKRFFPQPRADARPRTEPPAVAVARAS